MTVFLATRVMIAWLVARAVTFCWARRAEMSLVAVLAMILVMVVREMT
jgi:hypothetical protein